MKVKTTRLIKFKQLKRKLGGAPDWKAIGILETMWVNTCDNAPQGDIGKFSNEEIAAMLDWGEEQPQSADELVQILVDCKWLDESEEHRLVVHDWHDHAPNYIKGGLARSGKEFLSKPAEIQDATQGSTLEPTQDSSLETGPKPSAQDNPGRAASSQVNSSQAKSSQVIPAYGPPPAIETADIPEVKRIANQISKVLRTRSPDDRDFIWQAAIVTERNYSEDWLHQALERVSKATTNRIGYFRRCCQENAARCHRDFEEDLKSISKELRRAPPSESQPSVSASLGSRLMAESKVSRGRRKSG